jgi:hypothetical protein
MADVKKFTGFIAIDGSTHSSFKSASDHSRLVKIQSALSEKFSGLEVTDTTVPDELPDGDPVSMPDFIFANRDAILAALTQEVLTRKKRTPKTPKAADSAAPAETAPAV